MDPLTDLDILLIGKTGNGKSATGNSILRRKAFKSVPSATSVTTEINYELSSFDERVIKVVDGPGVGDTRLDSNKALELVSTKMEYAISANPCGYHAFLIVVRFGGRFSREDLDTIEFLKKIFGKDFVKGYCILVLTCGDNFKKFEKDTGQSFEEWCEEQTGEFKILVEECEKRVILFDNNTKDETKKRNQISKLLQIVDKLKARGGRYTDDNFRKASEARQRLMVESNKSRIKDETMKEASLIMFKIEMIKEQEDMDSKISALGSLLIQAENLIQSIELEDQGTGVLHEFSLNIKSLKDTVKSEITLCYKIKEERESARRHDEEQRRIFEDKIKQQKEDYERRLKEDERVIKEQFEQKLLRQKTEFEEKLKKDNERSEKQWRDEVQKQEKQYEKHEKDYKSTKAESDQSYLGGVYNTVTWPFRKIAGLFY